MPDNLNGALGRLPWDTQGKYKLTRLYMFPLLNSAEHKNRAEACRLLKALLTHNSCLKKRHADKENQGGHSFGAGSAMRESPHGMGVTSLTTKHISTTATALLLHSTSGQTLGLV